MTNQEQEQVVEQQEVLEETNDVLAEEPMEIPSLKEDSSEEEKPREVVDASEYKCFSCGKVIGKDYLKKRVRCPYCGSKIIFKARTKPNTVVSR